MSQQEDMLRRPVTPAQMKGQGDPVLHIQPKSHRSVKFSSFGSKLAKIYANFVF